MSQPVRVEVTGEQVGEQIIPVDHGLGTHEVLVTCYDADGQEVGYLAAVPLSPHQVEVVVVPGSGITSIEVVQQPAETD